MEISNCVSDQVIGDILSKSKRGWDIGESVYTGRINSLHLLADNLKTLPSGTALSLDQVHFMLKRITSTIG